MSDNTNQQIVSILMDIKTELGEQRGLLRGMHEKQDYTNGRVLDGEKRLTKIEIEQGETRGKVAMFGGLAGIFGSILVAFIKGKLGL